jgi:hypothetical protein
MARLQILELPTEHHGDDMVTPYLLVLDQVAADETEQVIASQEAFNGVVAKSGARTIAVFHGMTVDIPANGTASQAEPLLRVGEPVGADDAERAGITQIVHAHERTRLDLCSALLLDSDTTWRRLIELAAERQRELAGLYRKVDERPEAQLRAEALHAESRAELTRSENARDELRKQRDEARMWARHGYEIGQKHCGWTDHGVAPGWLTDGWPPHFDSCEHLKRASDYDMAISRGLQVADELEAADVHGSAYDANQEAARRIREALARSES